MKKIIILGLILISTTKMFAQNTEPVQLDIKYKGQTKLWSANDDEFKQNRFILGWHWGDGRKMSTALGSTQAHTESNSSVYNDKYKENIKLILSR